MSLSVARRPSGILRRLRKWWAVFAIYFQDGIAYRASGLIWITTDVVTAVTMPLVWASAAKGGYIQGFSAGDFVVYYLSMLLIASFVTSHIMWELATEIREGQFSTFLVRPVGFLEFTFFRNLSWRLLRPVLFLPFFLLLLWAYRGFLGDVRLNLEWEFWASLLLGHLVSYFFVVAMSMLALFVQEASSIFELYYFPMLFLSGQVFPVSLLPDWARELTKFFPFYFTSGAPTEILIGRVQPEAVPGILWSQVGWIALSAVAAKLLWSRGLRYYTGVGM
ncbi:MAG: ABC-2 family transporter protein [Fimbriimonadales bacterium]